MAKFCIFLILHVSIFVITPKVLGGTYHGVSSDDGKGKTEEKNVTGHTLVLKYGHSLKDLAEKCRLKKNLTDYEKRCCRTMESNGVPGPGGFSIIRQETQVMQFGKNISQALLTLLRRLNGSPNEKENAPNSCSDEKQKIMSDLQQCSKKRTECSNELIKVQVNIQTLNTQYKAQNKETESLKEDHEHITAECKKLKKQLENIEDDRDENSKKIDQLILDIKTTETMRVKDRENTFKISNKLIACEVKQEYTQKRLEEIEKENSDLDKDLDHEKDQLEACRHDKSRQHAALEKLGPMKGKLEAIQETVDRLHGTLNTCQRKEQKSEEELKQCAEKAQKLQRCESENEQCRRNHLDGPQQWRDKYHNCSNHIMRTALDLANAKHSLGDVKRRAQHLEKQLEQCKDESRMLKSSNQDLQQKNDDFYKRLRDLEAQNNALKQQIKTAQENHETCERKKQSFVKMLDERNAGLIKVSENNKHLKEKLTQQERKVTSEKERRIECEGTFKTLQRTQSECLQLRKEDKIQRSRNIEELQECKSSLSECSTQLSMLKNSTKECDKEDNKLQSLYEKCLYQKKRIEKGLAKSSDKIKDEQQEHSQCQERLSSVQIELKQCRDQSQDSVDRLKKLSESHADLANQALHLSEDHSVCTSKLEKALTALDRCNTSLEVANGAKETCVEQKTLLNTKLRDLASFKNDALPQMEKERVRLESCLSTLKTARNSDAATKEEFKKCENKLSGAMSTNKMLHIELEQCRKHDNMTTSHIDQWEQRHTRCVKSKEQLEERLSHFTRECENHKEHHEKCQKALDECQKGASNMKQMAEKCNFQLDEVKEDLEQEKMAKRQCDTKFLTSSASLRKAREQAETSGKLLSSCTKKLTSCTNENVPSNASSHTTCPKGYTAVGTHGEKQCMLLSNIRSNGFAMHEFCGKHGGQLLHVSSFDDLQFASDLIAKRGLSGKFLVDPSRYMVQKLGVIAGNIRPQDTCYFVDSRHHQKPLTSQLAYDKCTGETFGALCWTQSTSLNSEDFLFK